MVSCYNWKKIKKNKQEHILQAMQCICICTYRQYRLPQGNIEYGIVGSYKRLLCMPWKCMRISLTYYLNEFRVYQRSSYVIETWVACNVCALSFILANLFGVRYVHGIVCESQQHRSFSLSISIMVWRQWHGDKADRSSRLERNGPITRKLLLWIA